MNTLKCAGKEIVHYGIFPFHKIGENGHLFRFFSQKPTFRSKFEFDPGMHEHF